MNKNYMAVKEYVFRPPINIDLEMGSIAPITKALKDYISDLKLIKTEDQAEFKTFVDSAKKAFIKRINDARDKYPETIYLNYSSDLSEKEAKTIVERIAKSANAN